MVTLAPAAAHAVSFSTGTTFAVGGDPESVAVGDFNGDSRLDLAVANGYFDNVSILRGDGSGGFTGADQHHRQRDPPIDRRRQLQRRRTPRPGDVRTSTRTTCRSCSATAAAASARRPASRPADGPISIAVGDFNGDATRRPGDGELQRRRQRLDPARQRQRRLQRADELRRRQPPVLGRGRQLQRRFECRPGGRELRLPDDVSILLGNGSGGFSAPTNFTVGDEPSSVAVGDFNGDARPRPRGRERQLGQCLDPARQRERGLQRADQLHRRGAVPRRSRWVISTATRARTWRWRTTTRTTSRSCSATAAEASAAGSTSPVGQQPNLGRGRRLQRRRSPGSGGWRTATRPTSRSC